MEYFYKPSTDFDRTAKEKTENFIIFSQFSKSEKTKSPVRKIEGRLRKNDNGNWAEG